jgi:hypothetical protein
MSSNDSEHSVHVQTCDYRDSPQNYQNKIAWNVCKHSVHV